MSGIGKFSYSSALAILATLAGATPISQKVNWLDYSILYCLQCIKILLDLMLKKGE